MTNGAGTYDARFAPQLVDKLLRGKLDLGVGCRVDEGETENYRCGHRSGNRRLRKNVW